MVLLGTVMNFKIKTIFVMLKRIPKSKKIGQEIWYIISVHTICYHYIPKTVDIFYFYKCGVCNFT